MLPSGIPYKMLIQGRIASLNTLGDVSSQRAKQIQHHLGPVLYELISTRDNPYYPNRKRNASMGDLFSWTCEKESDGTTSESRGTTNFGLENLVSHNPNASVLIQQTQQAIQASACAP